MVNPVPAMHPCNGELEIGPVVARRDGLSPGRSMAQSKTEQGEASQLGLGQQAGSLPLIAAIAESVSANAAGDARQGGSGQTRPQV